jgi:AraC-like DNA-binding protein
MESGPLSDLARDDEESFLPFLKGLNETAPNFVHGKMAQDFFPILQQVLSCPYHGKTRALFLEGKVLELLARKFTLIQEERRDHIKPKPLKPADERQIRQAADLLVKHLEKPPDLSTLSLAVGLSRSKLHRCFCQVYGLSPLEFLQNHRLELTRQLMEQGDHNVSQAAYAVGYNSLSHFSKLFRTKYNRPPHECLFPVNIHTIPLKR